LAKLSVTLRNLTMPIFKLRALLEGKARQRLDFFGPSMIHDLHHHKLSHVCAIATFLSHTINPTSPVVGGAPEDVAGLAGSLVGWSVIGWPMVGNVVG
jgi:hypothetical protein